MAAATAAVYRQLLATDQTPGNSLAPSHAIA
jgi:hypothetical protein